ncbi:thioesterase II family protein [Nocardia sp. NRRL S-836]|uniref:thioesterase II family protein n=1 Tax=Nocardia sp. NRRL S-836 TaxID=1519492 RepID=UPI0006ADD25C|nr:alpha/beta fold hydrolase [Nocardia sp. NRRL S-836]KOV78034.1 oleoyl-ACP hydrolase [Nocardia sp. NRRL S-836]
MTRFDQDTWLRSFAPNPDSEIQVVCMPHAGGSASFYVPFAEELAPVADVLAVQYPGRQDRRHEPCIDDLGTLANRVAEALTPHLDRRTILFGHSMGATLAFEVARRTSAAHLFASGRRAPSCWRDERVHQRDDQGLIAEMQALNGTGSALLQNEKILRMVLPAVRADYRAAETYRYAEGPDITSSISVVVGDDDPMVTLDEAHAWQRHTTGTTELHVLPGGHFYLADHWPRVAGLVRDKVRELRSPRA